MCNMTETSRTGVRPFRFALIGALLALLMPGLAAALALGKINVQSALNQPFAAQIELSGAKTYPVEKVVARLASKQAFSRANIAYSPLFSGLNFAVKQRGDGTAYIKVWSARPIAEPILHFLVEARTPHGRLYRDYTLFLDPPVSNQPAPVVVAPGTTAVVTATPVAANNIIVDAGIPPLPLPAEGEVFDFQSYNPGLDRQSRPATTNRSRANASTYKVRAGDSLSKIAAKFTTIPKRNQMTVALYRANPQAFLGNVNGLKRGVVLRVPTADEMNAISAKAAQAELRRQAQAWKASGSQASAPQAPATLDPEAEAIADTGADNGNTDGLVIVAPSTTTGNAVTRLDESGDFLISEGGSNNPNATALAAAEQRAQTAEENATALQQQNQDLQTALQANQQQLAEMQQALRLRSDEISALQQRLQALETNRNQTQGQAQSRDRDASATNNRQTAAPQKPATTEDSGTAWWLLIIIGLLLLVLILFVLRRRNDEEDEEDHPFYKDPVEPTPLVSDASAEPNDNLVVEESDLDETLRADAEQEVEELAEQVDIAPVVVEEVDKVDETPLAFTTVDVETVEEPATDEAEPEAAPAVDFSALKLSDEEPQVVSDFSGGDEMNTKLDLARAYIDMDNGDEAADLLKNVIAEGDDAQREEAQSLLNRLS